MIRSSPSVLFPQYLGSHGSSNNGSPQPSQQGSMGHLYARNSSASPHSGSSGRFKLTNAVESALMDSATVSAVMGILEQSAATTGLDGNVHHTSNQVLLPPEDMFYAPQFYKQEPQSDLGYHQVIPGTTSRVDGTLPQGTPMQGQLPSPSMQATLPPSGAALTPNLPLPPPYPMSGQQTFDSGAPTLTQSSIEPTSTEIKKEDGVGENGEKAQVVCRWIDCNQMFSEQEDLVRHIEKVHIDQRRGDDFTCFWQGCSRQRRAFNARYKLLIHMRVHSGEKPNKCTVSTIMDFLIQCNLNYPDLIRYKIYI